MQPIGIAKEKGFSDDEILSFLQERFANLSDPINESLSAGYSPSEVLEYINNAGPTLLKKGQEVTRGDASQQPTQERGLIPSFKRGFSSSVSGLLTGQPEQVAPEDEGFLESLSELAGGLLGDVPAMTAGGAAGSAAGTAVLPGVGTVVGGGAGAFALPAIIKQAFGEYRDYAKGGGAGTFGEFLERSSRVAGAGAKGAVLGAVTSQASRLLPVLKRMPRFAKLLNTRIGKAIEEPLAEVATLTAGEAAIEGKVPTPRDIGKNVFAIGGFKLSKAALGKTGELVKKYTPFEAAARVASKTELMRRKGELEDGKQTSETESRLKLLDREIQKREDASTRIKETAETLKDVGSDIAKKANSFLPESLQKANESIVESISESYKKGRSASAKKKQEKYFKTLEEHIGKQRSEMIRSHYKWREELESPIGKENGKDVFLSDENLKDMMFYRQRTENPNVKGDTFEALKERLPEKAKTIMDEVVDGHFKGWLKRWNENPATLRKINPREGLEDIYLPGVYEETSKSKYTEAMSKADEMMAKNPDKLISKQFKTDGPFANAKVFETYRDAITKAGLKPRYDNIKDLLRYHDELMIRLEANNELVSKINKWQDEGGDKVVINSNDTEAYTQAKKDGWVPFEDKFLRMTKTKAGVKISPDRALVDPVFAKNFQGVFNKEAYKPTTSFGKFYDSVNNLAKVMRVSLSPFHVVALAESGIGGLGPDFFKGVGPLRRFFSENWWDEASKSFGDVDGLARRAEMGLSFKIPDEATYKDGQKILGDAVKAVPGKESLLKLPFKTVAGLVKKSHKWIFEEYQPRLKVATFDSYLESVLKRKVEAGETITHELTEKVGREVAEVVNNQFGGQISETISTLNYNDPKVQKWVRRVIGYPDWSISAIRQAANAIAPGVKGELAREYWIRYGAMFIGANYLMRFLYGGLSNKDDKENTFTWNPKKAFDSLETKDPNSVIGFPLPDVKLNIAGVEFNPGRDEKGRRLYSHVGKQALEIPRYLTDSFDALFGKSSPIIQETFKQLVGGTPYKGEIFPARGKFKTGQFMPWDATRKGTVSRAVSRGKEVLEGFIPFSLRGLGDRGIATTIATGGGAIPVRKGLSLKVSETYMIDAIKNKNPRKLKEIISILKDNGYDEKQIRNRIQLMKKFWVENKDLDVLSGRKDS